ncbi:HD-GYP domain-containing protein [Pseudalkalibacillus hwajinpoensis]|uniref:HD-GYP domain-containing protein n=1 Tax=Guptibacillus hwajinpoensis TaxID=208199 RepID=UPI00325AAB95
MPKFSINPIAIQEEERAIKLFMILFYIVTFSYDVIYGVILSKFILGQSPAYYSLGPGYILILMELILFPIAIYLLKRREAFKIKYYYFTTVVGFSLIGEIFIYLSNDIPYRSGGIAELFFVLTSPLFLNTRYFYIVTFGIIAKYSILLITLNERAVEIIIPLILISLFSIVSFILLNRFKSYVNAISLSYENQLEGIVKGIVATLELKDPYTRGHSERVAHYSQLLAKEMKRFDSGELQSFNYACLLHDVGKVHIPDHILTKPTRLSKEEYDIIKTHPSVGEEALRGMKGLEGCLDVVRSHHERWDGNGYPDQLEGSTIPLLARVTAIADAFDAMTSTRSYRPAMDPDKAYLQILNGKGTQFDPNLVEVFGEVYPEWVAFHSTYEFKAPLSSNILE